MTLHILTDLVQGSEEWHNARRGMITASVVGQLITPSTLKVANNDQSRSLIWELAAERITGWTEQSYVSADIWRGIDDEPRAVEHYAEHHAPVERVGFMVRETSEGYRVGFSPDGLVGDDGLIECKSRKPKRHLQTILSNTVPPADMAQVQCGLFVSGRPWCDYISWCGGMPMWPIRVTPDEQWFAAIHAAVEAYEQAARRMAAEYLRATRGLPTTERVTYETDYPELRLS
jgi:YqaJ-like viral recombinase domain